MAGRRRRSDGSKLQTLKERKRHDSAPNRRDLDDTASDEYHVVLPLRTGCELSCAAPERARRWLLDTLHRRRHAR